VRADNVSYARGGCFVPWRCPFPAQMAHGLAIMPPSRRRSGKPVTDDVYASVHAAVLDGAVVMNVGKTQADVVQQPVGIDEGAVNETLRPLSYRAYPPAYPSP
jgi:hypothetical protein